MERGPPEDKQESGLLQSSSSSCRGSPEGYLRQHPLRLEGFSGAEHATSSASASASSDGRRSPPPAAPFAPRHDRPRRALKRDPMFPVLSKTRSEMLGSSESSEGNMESSSMSQQQQQRQSSDEEFSRRDVVVQNESLLPEILVPESESLYDELDDLIEDFDVLGTDATEADAETETADEKDEEIEGACGGRNLARRSRNLPRKTGLHRRAKRLQRGRSRASGTLPSQSELQHTPGEKVASRAGHRTSPASANVAGRGRTLKSERCSCDVCGQEYANFSSLTVHKRRHTGERPFRCEFCPMSFVQSCALTKHMRKHTGERPYACARCGVTFTQKHGLNRHNRYNRHIR